MFRKPRRLPTRFSRLCALVLLAVSSGVVSAEIVLRLAASRSAFLQRALYRQGEAPSYDQIESLPELLESTPFHPTPFVDWGGFKLNSRGLRTHEYTRGKPHGTYRVVVLGDSFAFDSGFVPWDQIWHHRVGLWLGTQISRPVEVINLGVPAVGTRFYRRIFELEGRFLSPDLVLLSVFVGNDLTDESGARGSFLQRWSYTWRLATLLTRHPKDLFSTAPQPRGPGGHPVKGRPYDPDVPLNDPDTFLQIERDVAEVFLPEARESTDGAITDIVSVLDQIERIVREAGARLVVVLIPDRIEVEEEARRSGDFAASGAYDFDRVHQQLGDRLRRKGVDTIDLLPAFRSAPENPHLYRRLDTHWSTAGNALAADQIIKSLAELGIPIPRDPREPVTRSAPAPT